MTQDGKVIRVIQTKKLEMARGRTMNPFALQIVDTTSDNGESDGGLRVEWVDESTTIVPPTKAVQQAAQEVVQIVTTNPKASGNFIRKTRGGDTHLTSAGIELAERQGRITNQGSDAKPLWTVVEGGAP